MTVMSPAMAKFEAFAKPLVESGRFANEDEVMLAAIDALLREECDEDAKQAWLEQALEDGFASGVYEGDAIADIRKRLGLPQRTS